MYGPLLGSRYLNSTLPGDATLANELGKVIVIMVWEGGCIMHTLQTKYTRFPHKTANYCRSEKWKHQKHFLPNWCISYFSTFAFSALMSCFYDIQQYSVEVLICLKIPFSINIFGRKIHPESQKFQRPFIWPKMLTNTPPATCYKWQNWRHDCCCVSN